MDTAERQLPLLARPSQRIGGRLADHVRHWERPVRRLAAVAADRGRLRHSAGRAGLSVTVFSVSYMLSAPLLGRIADRVGRARMMTWCLLAFGAANLLTAACGNFAWLLAARLAAGATAAGVTPSVYALVGSGAPPDQARHLAGDCRLGPLDVAFVRRADRRADRRLARLADRLCRPRGFEPAARCGEQPRLARPARPPRARRPAALG